MTDHSHIEMLIEQSSLGTPGARRLRARTTAAVAREVLDEPDLRPATSAGAIPETVLAAARSGDPVAIDAVVEKLRPLIRRYCQARLLRTHPAAGSEVDEVIDAVCTDIARRLPDFAPTGRPLLGFAYGIASHHVLEFHHAEHSPASGTGASDPTAGLAHLLEGIDPIHREVLILRISVGLTAEETGKVLGLRPTAVRTLQHKALATLRRHMP